MSEWAQEQDLSRISASMATVQPVLDAAELTVDSKDTVVEVEQDLEGFLRSVERRALQMATVSTGDRDEALDLVQDAMMRLAGRYSERPASEWRPLFFRILHNRIMDWHRRHKVRGRWISRDNRSDEHDPLEHAESPSPGIISQLQSEEAMDALQDEIAQLPPRQRQALLLRVWEGMSVAETARVMGCGEGSVKTHYFRAVHSLKHIAEEYLS